MSKSETPSNPFLSNSEQKPNQSEQSPSNPFDPNFRQPVYDGSRQNQPTQLVEDSES